MKEKEEEVGRPWADRQAVGGLGSLNHPPTPSRQSERARQVAGGSKVESEVRELCRRRRRRRRRRLSAVLAAFAFTSDCPIDPSPFNTENSGPKSFLRRPWMRTTIIGVE